MLRRMSHFYFARERVHENSRITGVDQTKYKYKSDTVLRCQTALVRQTILEQDVPAQ